MLDLSENGLKSWFERLPEDIQSAIDDDSIKNIEGASALAGLIKEAEPAQYLDILNAQGDVLRSLGRIGRVRILSFICDRVYPFQTKTFHDILNADDEEGDGSSSVRLMLIEDIKKFNEAIAARVYKSSLDNVALRALQEAAFENQAPSLP